MTAALRLGAVTLVGLALTAATPASADVVWHDGRWRDDRGNVWLDDREVWWSPPTGYYWINGYWRDGAGRYWDGASWQWPAVIDVVSSHRTSRAQYTRAEMLALLDAVDWPHATREAALAVAWCESEWRPGATGAAGERGFWQVHPVHRDSTYDPVGNARAAYRISNGGRNWSAWTCRRVLR